MTNDYSGLELLIDDIKFFAWLTGSIVTGAGTLLFLFLRMYLTEALRAHTETIQAIVDSRFVRRDVYDADLRTLYAIIESRS